MIDVIAPPWATPLAGRHDGSRSSTRAPPEGRLSARQDADQLHGQWGSFFFFFFFFFTDDKNKIGCEEATEKRQKEEVARRGWSTFLVAAKGPLSPDGAYMLVKRRRRTSTITEVSTAKQKGVPTVMIPKRLRREKGLATTGRLLALARRRKLESRKDEKEVESPGTNSAGKRPRTPVPVGG